MSCNTEQKKYISDWINEKEIAEWIPGDIIMIVAGTGCGKSYFVKNLLRTYLKERGQKCLYLLSRVNTVEQFKSEMPDDNTIQFKTYQTVEKIKSDPFATLTGWDVIIADECHYFIDDSTFNSFTDLSFDWIMSQHRAIRIFMTATNNGIEEYFNEQKIMFTQYNFHGDYSHVRNLNFFWKECQLSELAKKIIDSGEKGIFFIQSAEKAYTLYQHYKGSSTFLCSVHNKNFSKYMDNTLIEQLLRKERFDCQLLFSTTALDTGVNIKDKRLTNIVVDVTEPTRIIQCIGRKRFIDDGDFLDLYIRGKSNKQIGGLIHKLNEKATVIKNFEEQGAISYNATYGRRNDDTGLIFDEPQVNSKSTEVNFRKRINKLKYTQVRQDIKTYQNMLSLGENGFVKYIAKLFGKEYSILEDTQARQSLTQFLKEISDIPLLSAQERKPLIEALNIRRNGRLYKSFKVLAAWLESSSLPYRLLEYQTSRLIDGKKKNYRAWKVVALK